MGKLKTLSKLACFSDYSPIELALLSTILEERQWSQGDLVCSEGEKSDAWMLIIDGELEIESQRLGGSQALCTLSAGDSLGELGILGASTYQVTARVTSHELTCYFIQHLSLKRLIKGRPELATKLLQRLGQQLGQKIEAALP